jgi:hypothetical protein
MLFDDEKVKAGATVLSKSHECITVHPVSREFKDSNESRLALFFDTTDGSFEVNSNVIFSHVFKSAMIIIHLRLQKTKDLLKFTESLDT